MAEERTERDVAHGPEGLKAEAGLRGPYGTSVRHIWPTWTLLVPAVTLISASLFLLLSLFASIFLKKLSFLDLTQISHHAFRLLFTSTIFRFLVPSISFHLSHHLSSRNPSFFVFFLSHICTLLAIISVFSDMMSVNMMARLYACPPSNGDEKVPSNFITHRGTISIMKYFGEYFGPRVNSIGL